MLDKFIASSVTTCQRFDETKVNIDRGKLLNEISSDNYRRFEHTEDGLSPRSKLGLENGIFWNTGDESDIHGHISEDPVNRIHMMDKRQSRLDYMASVYNLDAIKNDISINIASSYLQVLLNKQILEVADNQYKIFVVP